jgi:phage terminase large subunit GpA-like protein
MTTTTKPAATFKDRYKNWLKKQDQGEGVRGFTRFLSTIVQALTPRERLSPDGWADTFRYLTKGSRPGKWNTDVTPYMRAPCIDFLDDEVETIVLMWSTQVGKTAMLENVIGAVIHQYPSPMYFVMPDEALIRDFKQEKLEDMFESTPLFYNDGLVKRAAPGKSDTNDRKIRFAGGYLAFASSNSMSALAGRSIRYLFLDEVDRFKVDKGEGDVLVIAKNRTNSYAENRKIVITSTPTDSANSRINKAFLQGDQRRFSIACPHCGHRQFLIWSNVEWDKDKNPDGSTLHKPETAYYRCDLNGCKIQHGDKPRFLKTGAWVATAQPKDRKLRSYHINALYSPFVPFEDIARDYLAAKETPGGLRAFFNTAMAEVYDDPAEQPQYERLHARAEMYDRARPPAGVGALTAGVDVQEKGEGRIECSIWGWGQKNQRWLVDHIVIPGSYKDPETWARLDEVRRTTYTTVDGRELSILLTLVDSSAGNTTNYIYEYARLNRMDGVKAVKGSNRQDSKIIEVSKLDTDSNGKPLTNSIQLVRPNVHQFKKWLYHAITEVDDPTAAHYVHTPAFAGVEWHRQLCAEKVSIKGTREEFVKTYANEALDCAVYAHAAAEMKGLTRATDAQWREYFKRAGVEVAEENTPEDVQIVELCILKRVQINKKWYEPGDILDLNAKQAAALVSGTDPFAHITSEKPPLKSEINAKKQANIKPKRRGWLNK